MKKTEQRARYNFIAEDSIKTPSLNLNNAKLKIETGPN